MVRHQHLAVILSAVGPALENCANRQCNSVTRVCELVMKLVYTARMLMGFGMLVTAADTETSAKFVLR
jgi:hypothetical protein